MRQTRVKCLTRVSEVNLKTRAAAEHKDKPRTENCPNTSRAETARRRQREAAGGDDNDNDKNDVF